MQVSILGQLGCQIFPGLAAILGLEEIGPGIIIAMGIDDNISRCRVERRRFDAGNRGPFGQAGNRHFGPGFSTIRRDVHQAVIAAGPEQVFLLGRLGQGEDSAVNLNARIVASDRAARPFFLCLVVPRQVAADRLPRLPAVGRFKQDIGRMIDRLRVMGRNDNWSGPLEAVFQILAAVAGGIGGIDADIARLAEAVVVARNDAPVFARVNNFRIGRVGGREARFAAADLEPIAQADARATQAIARSAGAAQVLHAAGDAVGHAIVASNVIELRNRQGWGMPGLAAVGRDVHAAIVAVDDPLRVLGIDPNVVMIAVVRAFNLFDRFAAIDRSQQVNLREIDDIGVARINGKR